MSEKCPCCRHYHTGTCGTPQVCFHCGQIDHVKRFYLIMSGIDLVEQSLAQPRALVQDFGRLTVLPVVSFRFEGGSSSRTHGVQRS